MASWEDELGAMERHLEAQRLAVLGSGRAPDTYELPDGLGPLPDGLRDRAETLLAATLALEGEVAGLRNLLGRSLRAAGQRPMPPPAYYLDERA